MESQTIFFCIAHAVKTDVFEELYKKRPLKSAPAKPINRSIPIAITSNLKPTTAVRVPTSRLHTHLEHTVKIPQTNNTHLKPQYNPQLNQRSPKLTLKLHAPHAVVSNQENSPKPREYLFGTSSLNSKEKVQNKENEDRFKTITLKDVRRSFREKYLNNAKAEEQKHQPLWFVDVKGNGDYMRSGPNITDRRSQTRSVHDRSSIDRDTFHSDESRSNSFRSNDSDPRRSPSVVLECPQSSAKLPDQEIMHRSSSINVINSNGYATYKKKDPRFTPAEHDYDVWKSSPNITIPRKEVDNFETNPQPSITNTRNKYDQFDTSPQSSTIYTNLDPKPTVLINRKNTFKVVRDEFPSQDHVRPHSTSLKRRDTFVIDNPPASANSDTKRGYFLNRYRRLIEPEPEPLVIDRHYKVIPIGVAMPYSHQNDEPQTVSVNDRRRRFASSHQSMSEEPNVRDESPPLYASTTYIRPDSERQRSPTRRKTPEPRSSPTSLSKKPFRSRSTMIQIGESLKKPVESMKISFESLRKPTSPKRDPGQTNLGFDRFYDPNYYVPKNQNLFGPLASAQMRTVNVSVQPKINDRCSWLYSKSPK